MRFPHFVFKVFVESEVMVEKLPFSVEDAQRPETGNEDDAPSTADVRLLSNNAICLISLGPIQPCFVGYPTQSSHH